MKLRFSNLALSTVFVLVASLISVDLLFSQEQGEGPMTPEREAAAMTFAKRHHPELSVLLGQLKDMDAAKYQSAVTELFRTSERLARYQERFPDRYETELETWKIDSRVRLLVARSVKGMEEETRQEVKDLLMERNEVRRKQLAIERDKLKERMSRLDEQISQLKNENEVLADRDLDRLMKTVRTRTTTTKTKPTPPKTTPARVQSNDSPTKQSQTEKSK